MSSICIWNKLYAVGKGAGCAAGSVGRNAGRPRQNPYCRFPPEGVGQVAKTGPKKIKVPPRQMPHGRAERHGQFSDHWRVDLEPEVG